jgi:hypothetical protein
MLSPQHFIEDWQLKVCCLPLCAAVSVRCLARAGSATAVVLLAHMFYEQYVPPKASGF